MERIVVGMDGSDGAAVALRWAVAEAARHAASVIAVLAWGDLVRYHDGRPASDQTYSEADLRRTLQSFVRAAVGESPAARVEEHVVCDLPARALLDASKDADLLVVGARGLGGFRGLLMGSVSQQCLHHSHIPVAVIRATAMPDRDRPPRIVVGIDRSDTAGLALDWALDEARTRQAELVVVHTFAVPYPGGTPYAEPPDPAPFERDANDVVDAALARADTTGLSRPPVRLVAMVGTRDALVAASATADVVVLGARGVGGFRGMLLGSVSHAVAQHADCPVVVVPPAEDRDVA